MFMYICMYICMYALTIMLLKSIDNAIVGFIMLFNRVLTTNILNTSFDWVTELVLLFKPREKYSTTYTQD